MRFLLSRPRTVKETNKRSFQIDTLNLQMVDSAFSTNDTQCNVVAKTSVAIQKKISGAKNVQATFILTDLLCDCGLEGAECIFAQIEESSDGKTR